MDGNTINTEGWVQINSKTWLGKVNGKKFKISIVDTGTGFWTAETAYLYLEKPDGSWQYIATADYEHNIGGEEEKAVARLQSEAAQHGLKDALKEELLRGTNL
jgi:hypothetical protein